MSSVKITLLLFFICFSIIAFPIGKTFTVTNANNSGVGSLRASIDSVNANITNAANKHKIIFSSSIASPYTITLTSGSLPLIKEPVIIDGKINSSQNIIIHGNGTNILGIRIGADYCVVKNIYLKRFDGGTSARGINIDSSYSFIDSCKIDTCYRAIHVGGNYNTIKHCNIFRITASGNAIHVAGDYAQILDGNIIQNTNKTGNGINTANTADYTVIGGEILQSSQMNVIGGFSYGILDNGLHTKIYGNLLGGPSKLNSSSCSGPDFGLPNSYGINLSSRWAEVGKAGQSNDNYANIIIGNAAHQIFVASSQNKIIGNYLGIDKYSCSPSTSLTNPGNGIYINISGADSNIVGKEFISSFNEYDGNIICNHKGSVAYGVIVRGGVGNQVNGNFVGTTRSNLTTLGNTYGIANYGSHSVIDTNLVSGNVDGIRVYGETMVSRNKIGTTRDGLNLLSNSNGIRIGQSKAFVKNNLISGNSTSGILIEGDSALILGNYVGVNIYGDSLISAGNQATGVRISTGKGSIIGGGNSSDRNIISGNIRGILIEATAGTNKIIGNYIGTNPSALRAVPNTNYGIQTSANNTIIGGNNLKGEGNVISGNKLTGIICTGADSSIIKGNFIGTNVAGANIGNGGRGIWLYTGTNYNSIGSSIPGEGNIIAYNIEDGVRITSATSTNLSNRNKITGNAIHHNLLNSIYLNYGSATGGNDGKSQPTIDTIKYFTPTQLVFKGSAQSGDSIEVFSSDATGKNAYGYIGHGLTDGSGKWTITASVDTLSRYYVATAISNPSNNTSELSSKKTGNCYYFSLDTRKVNLASYDVLQGVTNLQTNLLSGLSGTNNGVVYIHPSVPSTSSTLNLKIKESINNDSLRIYLDIDKNLNISNLRGKIESTSFSVFSDKYFTIDTNNVGCDAIAFRNEPNAALPSSITTNLSNGITVGTTFEVYGLSGLQAELKVFQSGSNVPYTTLVNGASAMISLSTFPSNGLYKFILKLTDSTTPTPKVLYYNGQFLKN